MSATDQMSTKNSQDAYSLLQAFDLTGQKVFQNEWNGQEALAAASADPVEMEQRRKDIEDRLSVLWRRDNALQAQVENNPAQAERDLIAEESRKVWAERDALRAELNSQPDVTISQFRSQEEWLRRTEVEKLLREGLESGDLDVRLIGGGLANYADWMRERHFYISFRDAIVIPPQSACLPKRRYPAYIPRLQFDLWLDRFASDAVFPGEQTPEKKMRPLAGINRQ